MPAASAADASDVNVLGEYRDVPTPLVYRCLRTLRQMAATAFFSD
jgi:hypothetical protein